MRKCTDDSEGDGQWLMEKLKNLIGTITTLTELILIFMNVRVKLDSLEIFETYGFLVL